MATKKATKAATKTAKATTKPEVLAAQEEKPKKGKKAEPVANGSTSGPSHEQIAERAYLLWEEDGRKHGRAEHYWLLAEKAL